MPSFKVIKSNRSNLVARSRVGSRCLSFLLPSSFASSSSNFILVAHVCPVIGVVLQYTYSEAICSTRALTYLHVQWNCKRVTAESGEVGYIIETGNLSGCLALGIEAVTLSRTCILINVRNTAICSQKLTDSG